MSYSSAARLVATAVCTALVAPILAAQGQTAQPAAASSPAKQVGLLVYPAKGQTAEVQAADEKACYDWAQQQTGHDLNTPPPNADSAGKAAKAKTDSATTGAAVGGAAKGAVAGVAIGAIFPGGGAMSASADRVGSAVGGQRRTPAHRQRLRESSRPPPLRTRRSAR